MNKSVRYGQIGLNGLSALNLVMEEHREEKENVFCQKKNLDCFVQARRMKKGNAIQTDALFGQSGRNGPLAQKLVTAA